MWAVLITIATILVITAICSWTVLLLRRPQFRRALIEVGLLAGILLVYAALSWMVMEVIF